MFVSSKKKITIKI